jgi:hypothetical protein
MTRSIRGLSAKESRWIRDGFAAGMGIRSDKMGSQTE